jgi:alpha-amylase
MGVLMQGFYWDCPREEHQEHTWWNFVATKLNLLQNCKLLS